VIWAEHNSGLYEQARAGRARAPARRARQNKSTSPPTIFWRVLLLLLLLLRFCVIIIFCALS
jgi:hypothetical protein